MGISSMTARAAGEPLRRRGYHHNGVASSRPSASATYSRSSSQCAATGRLSTMSRTKVVIPRLHEGRSVFTGDAQDFVQVASGVTVVYRNAQVAKPDLHFLVILADMHVRWLPGIRRV